MYVDEIWELRLLLNDCFKVSSISISPDFKALPVWSNDVALIKLAEPVEFSAKIIPACLSSSEFFGSLAAVSYPIRVKMFKNDLFYA